MGKTVAELFSDIDCAILGDAREEVRGIAYRSDCVKPGDAFFCIVGLKADGHSFVQDAIDRGARVVVVERKVYLADATGMTEVMVKDTRKAMAQAASAFYDYPAQAFSLVGITGTNGKTTVTYLVDHIVNAAGKKGGIIGTTGARAVSLSERLDHTTPESPDLQRLFSIMRDAGCSVVAMEVSSHALDLQRTWGSCFAVTAFTNLTQDHLDYHHTFEDYFEAKAHLFSNEYPAKRVICIDDTWGQELLRRCSEAQDIIMSVGFTHNAQIHPLEISYSQTHTELVLSVRGEHLSLSYPLVGKFNVSNVMLAVGICMALGISVDTIVDALRAAPHVPGRLERVEASCNGGLSIYVDYAHTPDALEKAIASIKAVSPQRTIVVFGCGGDRDATKRSIMGRVALSADYVVVTSDNPRSEDPQAIITDILDGMSEGRGRFEIEADRRLAIARAVAYAQPGDSILIAGKGHEDYQLVGSEVVPFDDRVVAREELEKRFGGTCEAREGMCDAGEY